MFEQFKDFAYTIPVILGLVEFIKVRLQLEGRVVELLSLVIGVLFAVMYKAAELYPEVGTWVYAVVAGIAVGLAASGLYDFSKRFMK